MSNNYQNINNDQYNSNICPKKNEEKENNIMMKSTVVSSFVIASSSDWRSNNETKTTTRRKSYGISPQKFHNTNNNNDDSKNTATNKESLCSHINMNNNYSSQQQTNNENDIVNNENDNDDHYNNTKNHNLVLGFNTKKNGKHYIHKMQRNISRSNYTKYQESMELKRSIYRQYTTCKTWGLQQYAMNQYNDLLSTYGITNNINNRNDNNNNYCKNIECDVILTGDSSSGNSSTTDHPEMKKPYTTNDHNNDISPTKYQLRKQYEEEFLYEQKLLTSQNDTLNDQYSNEKLKNNELITLYNKPSLWSIEPRIWSKESSTTGTRKYITSHIGRFIDWYWRKCEIHHRHCYEMILENTPCRLYIDIEYNKKDNINITDTISEELLNELYSELSHELNIQYGINNSNTTDSNEATIINHDDDYQQQKQQYIGNGIFCDELKRHHIVDLDSTTSTKFSRHWIVHIPSYSSSTNTSNTSSNNNNVTKEVLFPDAISVGKFMKNFISRLANEKAIGILKNKRPILDQYLFIRTGKKKQQQQQQSSSSPNNNVPNNTSSASQSTTTSDVLTTTTSEDEQIDQEQLVHHHHDVNNDHDNIDNIDEMTCFIDLGVYTRNRLFRLLGSFKYGKSPSAALRIANHNQYPFPNGFHNGCFYKPDIMMKKKQCLPNTNTNINSSNDSSILEKTNDDFKNKILLQEPKKEESNELDGIPTTINYDTSSIQSLNDCNNGQLLSISSSPKIDTTPSSTTTIIDYTNLIDPEVIAKSDWTAHAEALACTLVVPLNVFKLDYLILPKPSDGADTTNNKHGHYNRFTSTSSSSLGNNQKQGNLSSSPYPILDEYVLNHLATRGGIQGTIQKWLVTYCDNEQQQQNQQQRQLQVRQINRPALISYHMLRNRWCDCVGRQHKSNNIMWNIDLMSGPPYRCYQTCWDIDCRRKNFSGCNSIYLPESVSYELQELLLDEQLSQIDLDDLTNNHSHEPVLVSSQETMNNIDNPNFQRKEIPQSDASHNQFDNDADDLFEQALANLDLSDIIK